MKLLPKIITALLTLVITSANIIIIWDWTKFPADSLLPWDWRLWLAIGVLQFGLLVFYCNHLAENENVSRFSRILWFVRFFILGFIAFPLYWVSFVMNSVPDDEEYEEEVE